MVEWERIDAVIKHSELEKTAMARQLYNTPFAMQNADTE